MITTVESSLVFGTPLQQYAQKFINMLHKFQLNLELTDENYLAWHKPIHEAFMSIEYAGYLDDVNLKIPSPMSDEQHNKARFLITMYIL
ncbi:hypothetical protein CROQUDRAFT_55042, partial [Cronartium quercuum f. sp. fusiforme G11]